MKEGKLRFRALGLVGLALMGVMAAGANVARGQTHNQKLEAEHKQQLEAAKHALALLQLPLASDPGYFQINLGDALLATVAGQSGEALILFPGWNVEFRCTSLHLEEEGKINSSTDAQGRLRFLGCLTFVFSTGAHLANCILKAGFIKAEVLILPIQHNGETYLLFEPPGESTSFMAIAFQSGIGCPLALNNEIRGSLTAQVDTLDAVTHLILFTKEAQLLTDDRITFGSTTGYVEGQMELALSGEHTGQKLGIH